MANDPVLIAYAAKRTSTGKRTVRTRIGHAYPHEAGSGLTVVLDAIPVDGRIVLLELDDADDRRLNKEVAMYPPEYPLSPLTQTSIRHPALRTLPDSSRIEQAVASAKATAKFQVSEETGVVAAIDHWLSNAQRDAVAGKSKPDKAEQAAAKSLDEIMQSLLTEARDVLDRLSAELNQPSAVPDNARAAQSDV